MPDFEKVHQHARALAYLTSPDHQDLRHIITWPVEVSEHWQTLVNLWTDPTDDFWNGVPLREITPAHLAEIEQTRVMVAHPEQHRSTESQLERPSQINIDARHAVAVMHRHEQPPRRVRCGNCGTRYEVTDDPAENHHLAQHHARICPKRQMVADEHAKLTAQFQEQAMQKAFSQRAADLIRQGADPALIRATGVDILTPRPRRWWKFLKWFA